MRPITSPVTIPESLGVNGAQHARAPRAGHCWQVARPTLERLAREPGEGERFDVFQLDAERGSRRDRFPREQSGQPCQQCTIVRATAARRADVTIDGGATSIRISQEA